MSQHLVPFAGSQIAPTVTPVDAIWDTYTEENLKTLTHQHRGLGPHAKIGDGHTLEALPPIQAALYHHIHRTVLQAIIWNQATSVHLDIPVFKD